VDPAPATLPSGTVYRCSTSGNILYICIWQTWDKKL
jgi:hypothetical protein